MLAILGGPAPADPAPLLPLLLAGAAAAIAAAVMGAAATVATAAQVPAPAIQVGGWECSRRLVLALLDQHFFA